MTKSLTEQWREGKLPIGKYYIKIKWWGCDGKWHYEKEEDIDYFDGDWRFYQDDAVAEVLSPVPSYDEHKRLQEQLNDANETIKEAQELCPDKNVMLMCNPARPSFGMMTNDVLTKYLEKWGVK